MERKLHKHVMATSRWSNYAISPLDFESKAAMARAKVLINPGWEKRPKMLAALLFSIADQTDFMPICVDDRTGYSDRPVPKDFLSRSLIHRMVAQSYQVSDRNPFFTLQSREDNRYRLRRPTGLAAMCVELGIEEAMLVGHSEGARIVTTVAAESNILRVPKLIVINAVGTGETGGTREVLTSSWQARHEVKETNAGGQAALSAVESFAESQNHPDINYFTTEGTHSNVYTLRVQQQIVDLLAA